MSWVVSIQCRIRSGRNGMCEEASTPLSGKQATAGGSLTRIVPGPAGPPLPAARGAHWGAVCGPQAQRCQGGGGHGAADGGAKLIAPGTRGARPCRRLLAHPPIRLLPLLLTCGAAARLCCR